MVGGSGGLTPKNFKNTPSKLFQTLGNALLEKPLLHFFDKSRGLYFRNLGVQTPIPPLLEDLDFNNKNTKK